MSGLSCTAMAQDITAGSDGIVVQTNDVRLTLGGRVHLDAVLSDDDVTMIKDEINLRRLRVDATVDVGDDWTAKFDADIGGISTGLRNVWLAYKGIDDVTLRAGNLTTPFSGERQKSSNHLKFLERSLAAALAPGFRTGGAVTYSGDNIAFTAAYVENPIDADDDRQPREDGSSIVGKIVWTPIRERKRVLFVAGAIDRRDLNTGAETRVRSTPEFGLSFSRLVDTGNLDGVSSYINLALEAGYAHGPFAINGQYLRRFNDAAALGDPEFSGGSIEAAYVLTGERQRFSLSSGSFGAVRPTGKLGAVEIAARVSFLDLEDGSVTGGKEKNFTAGTNWYIGKNIKFALNYIHAEVDPGRFGFSESVDAVATRLQIAF
ncbi:porin [Sphingorhabdus sp. Alg231-15]|uniref:porin n=1 Tax=Sphingorhabdus sp. Alg231-15 TaxID=1922222 RepID=UPI000D55D8C7